MFLDVAQSKKACFFNDLTGSNSKSACFYEILTGLRVGYPWCPPWPFVCSFVQPLPVQFSSYQPSTITSSYGSNRLHPPEWIFFLQNRTQKYSKVLKSTQKYSKVLTSSRQFAWFFSNNSSLS